MTICLVGLPFTANAAEIIGSSIIHIGTTHTMQKYQICDCGVNYTVVNESPTYDVVEAYALANKCCRRLYTAVRAQCPECGVLTTIYDVYETRYSHKYLTNGQCEDCGYWRASK